MERIDALGSRPDRHAAFTQELLAEAEDRELQTIVEEAARDLDTPIALVTLVLEHIQFFKAHYGLPPDLAAARGTERDVSFCQFVVKDGEPFEVNDAAKDDRVPKYLVEQYGIRAYLGMPIVANDSVVGSLCVIDTEPRPFSEDERHSLEKLALLVNARLGALAEQRRKERSLLVARTAPLALSELRDVLAPIDAAVATGRVCATALASFLRLAEHARSGGEARPGALERAFEASRTALEDCRNSFAEIELAVGDARDSLSALEHVLTESEAPRLSEVAVSGRELARPSTLPVGGVFLPELPYDPRIYTSRPVGVALLATCLSLVAARMASAGASSGIRMQVRQGESEAEIALVGEGLDDGAREEIAAELERHSGIDPSVAIRAADGAIRIAFRVVPE